MNAHKGVILIVDDVPTNLNVLMEFLESSGFRVLVATDGESAVEQAEYAPPDIILLDVMMPGIDGFETCRRLKASKITHDVPIIFMTALTETVDKVHGFELGAADYITKPLQQEEAVARVNAHLTLHRQKQEIERLRADERLHYEQLNKIKDEILSTASHDLRDPLNIITMSIHLLRRYISQDDVRSHTKLNHIEAAAKHMRDLIVNLLDLARLETGLGLEKQLVYLKQILESSLDHAITWTNEKGILLNQRLPEFEISIQCDPIQIGQVVDNLISNAVKYTPEGGTVEVSADVEETQVYVQVRDTGIGIPEKDLPHVFDKFYRVNTIKHREVSGTGLGLSIVREIVHQHGGEVWVNSTMGMGSTFSFTLPL